MIFICLSGNSCIRIVYDEKNQEIKDIRLIGAFFEMFTFFWKQLFNNIISDDSYIEKLIRIIKTYFTLYNPWFMIPLFVVLTNLTCNELAKKHKKFEWLIK